MAWWGRMTEKQPNRYAQLIQHIFQAKHHPGATEVSFEREDIERAAAERGIRLPKNLGDVIYSFRYRVVLPESVQAQAPAGHEWIIRPAGSGRYAFVATLSGSANILPDAMLPETRVPDSTPGLIARYALSDEQALLAKRRYNRLIDLFSGVVCYSLQSHLRTQVSGLGQVETDEIYVGMDRRGAHFVLPVQAKGGKDRLSVVQIEQDFALCAAKFPRLVCRPVAAQFMADDLIALFEFEQGPEGVKKLAEKHYRLVAPRKVSNTDLDRYRGRVE